MSAIRYLILFCIGAICVRSQPCVTQDFGISYQGTKVFTVSSSNNTCACLNYVSDGLSTFRSAAISSLAVDQLTNDSESSITISGPVVLSDRVSVMSGLLDLGAGDGTRETDAGKIAYASLGSPDALTIVGAGSSIGARQVNVRDQLQVGTLASIGGAYRCGGLRGVYYQARQLEEPPVCVRTDTSVNFNWPGVGPCVVCGGQLDCTEWSARWTGYILAPVTGNLTLAVTSDDGVRLWWDDSPLPILSAWNDQTATYLSEEVTVVAGKYYAIRLEYYQANATYWISLNWFYDGQTIEAIPASNLCSATGVQVESGQSSFGGEVTFRAAASFLGGVGGPLVPTAVRGSLSVDGSVSVAGSVDAGSLNVDGVARFPGGIGLQTDALMINAAVVFNGPVTVSDPQPLTMSEAAIGPTGIRASTAGGNINIRSPLVLRNTTSLFVGGVSRFIGSVNTGHAAVEGHGNVGIGGNLSVIGTGSFIGSVGFGSSVTVDGDLTLHGNFSTAGIASFGARGLKAASPGGSLAVSSPLVLSESLSVAGASNFVGATNFGAVNVSGVGNVGIAGNLAVFGVASFGVSGIQASYPGGSIDSYSPVHLVGASSSITVDGTSQFFGAANFGNGSAVGDGNVGIGGTLSVSGLASFGSAGIIADAGALRVGSPVVLTGPSSLAVGGTATFAGGVNFGNSNVTGGGNVGIAGSLTVSGLSSFAGPANMGAVFARSMSVTNNLTVAGPFTSLASTSLATPVSITGAEIFDITVNSGVPADVGSYPSVTFVPADGLAMIAFYDATNKDLRMVKCANADCSVSTNAAVDWVNDVGQWTSIAARAGQPTMISYYDLTLGYKNLRLAVCPLGDTYCRSPILRVLDSSSADIGAYTACTYGSDELLMIAYRDTINAVVQVAHCDDNTCSSMTKTTIDSSNTIGAFLSIAYNPADSRVVMVFIDQTASTARLARCTNVPCTTFNLVTIADSVTPIARTSIAISATVPLISFFRTGYGLVLFQCLTSACSAFGPQRTIDATASQNSYSTIAVPPGGFPVISYVHSSRLMIATCGDAFCTSVTIRNTAVSATHAALAIGPDSFPFIAFWHSSSRLGVMHCTDALCSSSIFTNPVSNTARQSITVGRNGRNLLTVDETGAITANSLTVTTLTANTLAVKTSQNIAKHEFGRASTGNTYYYAGPLSGGTRVTFDTTGCTSSTSTAGYCHEPTGVLAYYYHPTTPSYLALNLLGVASYSCTVLHTTDKTYAGGQNIDLFLNSVSGTTANSIFGVQGAFSMMGVGNGGTGYNALALGTGFYAVCM
eukprot:TRINITY_DN26891_c0_g1_i1.p1 TRINITY_DN26891_c0_g1~~TRINITY_DN26891_c0_g1_i1.p1  ORF type:complete len:1296 (+),score=268.69 TRINITY_DN26891_c0_g1_i1:89-3976(+)